MNGQVFIKFCRRLFKDVGQKIYLILDNLRIHHRRMVKQWVAQHYDKIELKNKEPEVIVKIIQFHLGDYVFLKGYFSPDDIRRKSRSHAS
jgi:hypothetical protein